MEIHKAVPVIALISAILSIAATQIPSSSQFSCLSVSKFQGTQRLQAYFVQNQLFLIGCTGNQPSYSFRIYYWNYWAGIGGGIKFTPNSNGDLCSENDRQILNGIIGSISHFRIFNRNGVSSLQFTDSRKEVLIILIFQPTEVRSEINPKNWDGRYQLQFPTVTFSFSSTGNVWIDGCKKASASYEVSENGTVKFTNSAEKDNCELSVRYFVHTMESFTQLSLTDRDQCELRLTQDPRNSNYSLSAIKVEERIFFERTDGKSTVTKSEQYTFTPLNYSLKTLKVTHLRDTPDSIQCTIEGCNPHTVLLKKLQRLSLNQYRIEYASSYSMIMSKCEPSMSQTYADAFKEVKYFEYHPTTAEIELRSASQATIYVGKEYKAPAKIEFIFSLVGKYSMNYRGPVRFDIIEDNRDYLTMQFLGCSQMNLTFYRAWKRHELVFTSIAKPLYRQDCNSSHDQQNVALLRKILAVNFIPEKDELRFYTIQKREIYIARKDPITKYLKGHRALYMNEEKPFVVFLSGNTLVYWNCYEITYTFRFTAKYRIKFEFQNRTEKTCETYNSEYDQKFESIVRFELNQITNVLRFFNANSEIIYSELKSDFSHV